MGDLECQIVAGNCHNGSVSGILLQGRRILSPRACWGVPARRGYPAGKLKGSIKLQVTSIKLGEVGPV